MLGPKSEYERKLKSVVETIRLDMERARDFANAVDDYTTTFVTPAYKAKTIADLDSMMEVSSGGVPGYMLPVMFAGISKKMETHFMLLIYYNMAIHHADELSVAQKTMLVLKILEAEAVTSAIKTLGEGLSRLAPTAPKAKVQPEEAFKSLWEDLIGKNKPGKSGE